MAITYRANATATFTTTSTLTINKPTGTVENDVMIACLVINPETINSVPDGWTLLYNSIINGTIAERQYTYWKLAGASEGSSYSWGTTGNTSGRGAIISYDGCDTTTPIGNTTDNGASNSRTPVGLSINIQRTNGVALWVCAESYTNAIDQPSGYTERVESLGAISIEISEEDYASTGATGDKSGDVGTLTQWRCVHIELLRELIIVELAGTVTGASSVSGQIHTYNAISGSLGGTSSVSGNINCLWGLAGAIAGESGVTGNLHQYRPFSGSVEGVSSVAGVLNCLWALSGSIAGVSEVTGDVRYPFYMAGSIGGVSSVDGTLNLIWEHREDEADDTWIER